MDSQVDPAAEEPHPARPARAAGSLPARHPAPVRVPLDALVLTGSPRLDGENVEHTRVLSEVAADLPPILVHAATMRVVDGLHRVQAARLRGETEIAAVFFDGDGRAAFVKAVEANVAHGLPLSFADRRTAAARIIASYPEWSDRAVAASAGLSPKTVRAIRERLTGPVDQTSARVGRDGKVRPLSTAEGRWRAAALIAERPAASLREIASLAGVSPATVLDVRQRVRNGESPVPLGVRPAAARPAGPGSVPGARAARAVRQLHKVVASSGAATPSSLLQRLKEDPSLRYSEKGRNLLRWLDSHVVELTDWTRAAEGLPPHCVYTISELAIRCAQAWERLAEELWVRVADGDSDLAA